MTPEEYKMMPTGSHGVSIGINHINKGLYGIVIDRGKAMTSKEIKMLKQLLEVRDLLIGIINKGEWGAAMDRGAQLLVSQMLERYKTTEGEILEHTTE